MIETTGRGRRSAALMVAAAAVLWSAGGVGVKVADAEPLVVAGLRSAFALAFMGAVLLVTMRRGASAGEVVALLRRPLVWGASVAYGTMVITFVLAARRTTAANAIVLQYTGPVYVALLGGPLLGERASRRDVAIVGACLAGMVLAFAGELGGGRAAGNVLALVSSFGFAGLPLLLRLDQKRLGDARAAAIAPLVAMTLGNALAAIVALPAIVLHPPGGGAAIGVVAALGVFQIGVPYVLYGIAVRRLRALESSLIATIEPILSPVWVLLATGERPSGLALAGGAIIVVAVAAQALGKR